MNKKKAPQGFEVIGFQFTSWISFEKKSTVNFIDCVKLSARFFVINALVQCSILVQKLMGIDYKK
jgi:hypothetical protein